MGTGPAWVRVKWAHTEQGPPLLQAEVHEGREAASQESRTVFVTCVACEIEAGQTQVKEQMSLEFQRVFTEGCLEMHNVH